MISLKSYLEQRIAQQEQRKMMIPRYVDNPNSFLGKRDFSMDDIPCIDADIRECKIALKAIIQSKKDSLSRLNNAI